MNLTPNIQYPLKLKAGVAGEVKVKLITQEAISPMPSHPDGYPVYVSVHGFWVKAQSEDNPVCVLPVEGGKGAESSEVVFQVTPIAKGEIAFQVDMVNAYGVPFWGRKFTMQVT